MAVDAIQVRIQVRLVAEVNVIWHDGDRDPLDIFVTFSVLVPLLREGSFCLNIIMASLAFCFGG